MFERRKAQLPRKQVVRSAGKRIGPRKKPVWDSTVSDLTVHQLSKEEIELRRSRILSKNAEKAKRELEEASKSGRQQSPSDSVHRSSVGPGKGGGGSRFQEKELSSVLEESDRAIAVVRDLFGDDPKRYGARPNVTVAPHVTSNRAALERALQESRLAGSTPSALNSPGGIRDESILGLAPVKPALNELPSPSSEFSIDESSLEEASSLQLSPPGSYQPAVVDLPRFQRLLEEERGGESGRGESRDGDRTEVSSVAQSRSQLKGDATAHSNLSSTQGSMQPAPQSGQPSGQQHPLHIAHKMPVHSDRQHHHHQPPITSQPTSSRSLQTHSAGNTGHISRNERLRKLPPGRPPSTVSASSGIHDDLSILQQLVQNLELELQEYEQTSGYCFPTQKPETVKSGTFSSLTASLLSSVTKLTHYLKQSEIQLKGEVAVRNQLLHAMAEQQNLMDALTADVVKLQEENTSLKDGFHQLKQDTTQQAKSLEESISELHIRLSSLESSHIVPCHAEHPGTAQRGAYVTSPHVPTTPSLPTTTTILRTENKWHTSVAPASLPLAAVPSYNEQLTVNTAQPTIPTAQPLLYLPHGLTPSPLPTSASSLPATHQTPYPWSLLDTHISTGNQESIPAQPSLQHTPSGGGGLEDGSRPSSLTPAPAPLFTTPLTVPREGDGLSHTPSELGISPPPISVALQVPSLHYLPSLPPFPLLPLQGHNNPLSSGAFSVDRPPLPSTVQPLGASSVPYSWTVPPPAVNTAGGVATVSGSDSSTPPAQQRTSTSTLLAHSVSSPFTTPVVATPAVTHPQGQINKKTAIALPDLSLTATSLLPVSDTSTTHRLSPSHSDSSLDIEASLARMSSLARSVLQELAEDRGQLTKISEHPRTSRPLPSSGTLPPPSPHTPSLLPVSRPGSMTHVTSLDSMCSSELTVSTTGVDSASTIPHLSSSQEHTDQ